MSKHWRVYVVSASVALGAWLSAPTPAYALPSGSEVVHGEAHIGQSGSDMTIDQTTDKAIINWDEFGIGTNESVTFHQPTAGSVALNRVLGDNPSEIYGRLTANGHIFLLNAQGVLFGKGAEVRTGGFVASSLALSDADFLAGDYTFTATADNGSVVNEGEIDVAPGGMVALIGPQVQNTGDINAPEGAVALGAGGRVTLRPAGELPLAFEVDEAALGALVQNDGELRANGGLVVLSARAKGEVLDTAVSSSGIIEARSLEARDGTIRLVGGDSGVVEVSGTLNAGGGTIDVWGDQVVLSDGAALSGETSIYYNPVSYDDADT